MCRGMLCGLVCVPLVLALKKSAISAQTSFGELYGEIGFPEDGGVAIPEFCHQFLGIPFAKPPTGDYRFEPPQPWTADYATQGRPAKSYGPACAQESVIPGTSEDCLYLNVFTPASVTPGDNLPVLVWIHGGSFVVGSGSSQGGLPAFFLNMYNGYDGKGGVGTNYGIQDQREALSWVGKQVKAFGGDPNQITIFGESAGAISVLHHVVSPLSKGLFKRAISESGFPAASTSKYAISSSLKYAASLGCSQSTGDEVKKCLRSKSVADLVKKAGEQSNPFTTTSPWSPVIDGKELSDLPSVLFGEHKYNDVDLLLGTNTNEGVLFVYPNYPSGIIGQEKYQSLVRTILSGHDPAIALNVTTISEILGLYPGTDGDNRKQVSAILTDYFFTCSSQLVAEVKNRTYLYRFDHRSLCLTPFDLVLPGVCHTFEIPFVFETPVTAGCIFDPEEVALAMQMTRMWTNFAKFGDPTRNMTESWPYYTGSKREDLLLHTATQGGLAVEQDFLASKCRFWRQVYGGSN